MNVIDLDVTHLDKDKLGVTLEDLVDNLRKEFIRIKVDMMMTYHLLYQISWSMFSSLFQCHNLTSDSDY